MCLCSAEDLAEGWRVEPIGEILDYVIGGDWGKDDYSDEFPNFCTVIRGTELKDVLNSSITKIPQRYIKSSNLAKRRLREGDIVFEISGGTKEQPTGRTLLITNEILELLNTVCIPASFCRLVRGKNIETCYFLAMHLKILYDAGGTFEYQIQSTGLSNFQFTYFSEKHEVEIPPLDVIDNYYKEVKGLYSKIGTNLQEIQTLTTLRDNLLPKLMNGEIAV
jgi:type I restriction enzyme, S subunit